MRIYVTVNKQGATKTELVKMDGTSALEPQNLHEIFIKAWIMDVLNNLVYDLTSKT